MIYKRGKRKLGSDGRGKKCGKRGACGKYWYKVVWEGKLVRESTKQGQRQDRAANGVGAPHFSCKR
jgi:hypothetical protein